MLDLRDIRALTFDCYGTLIDWLGGVRKAVAAMPSLAGCDLQQLIADRGKAELELEAGAYRPYSEVLIASLGQAARAQGLEPSLEELRVLPASMPGWLPFDESVLQLKRLSARYTLAILSNVETSTLEASVKALEAPFGALITAEQLRSYKPAHAHFVEAPRRLGLQQSQILHVAQSLVHDIVPATALGYQCVWVNRLGEPLPADVAPTAVVSNLSELGDLVLT